MTTSGGRHHTARAHRYARAFYAISAILTAADAALTRRDGGVMASKHNDWNWLGLSSGFWIIFFGLTATYAIMFIALIVLTFLRHH
jgi:hypothetical protein